MLEIPRDRLTIRFSRSGGPGGQNVNKVETKVEVRFRVDEADWIPERIRNRLRVVAAPRINREGELVVSSSRSRSQAQNLEDCLAKLRECLAEACKMPKRRVPTRPKRSSREKRLKQKKRRGAVKRERRWRGGDEGN